MWGFPMKFTTPSGLHVVMRAFREGEETVISELISSEEVCRYINLNGSQTPAQEQEWIKNTAEEKDSVHWALCLVRIPMTTPDGLLVPVVC